MAFTEGWNDLEIIRAIEDDKSNVPVCAIDGKRCWFIGCRNNSIEKLERYGRAI